MMKGIFPFMTQQKRAMARREREGGHPPYVMPAHEEMMGMDTSFLMR